MEKFFLKPLKIVIETWIAVFLIIVAIIGFIGFGALVEKGATDGNAPWYSKAALAIARIPVESRTVFKALMLNEPAAMAKEQRFEGEAGFDRFVDSDDQALLLSRHDGDHHRPVVEIIDLQTGAVLHRYIPDIAALNSRSVLDQSVINFERDKGPSRYPINHPILTDDGGLIFNGMGTPLAKIDVCSNILWTVDNIFHHSIERDADGAYWSTARVLPPTMTHFVSTAREDTIVQISEDGEVLFEKSVPKLLVENGLGHMVYTAKHAETAVHINDVQPTLNDGPHWRRGDLFLSLREPNAIVQYRPSTNEVLLVRQGPWLAQHDVDFVNVRELAVFNNNVGNLAWGDKVLGVNDTVIYDIETGETSTPFAVGYERHDIRTVTEGRSEILPDGGVFVEEQNYGRLLKMNQAGDIVWRYVNRANDGRVYLVHWSRLISLEAAEQTAALAKAQCGG